jgi:hypothetical protein
MKSFAKSARSCWPRPTGRCRGDRARDASTGGRQSSQAQAEALMMRPLRFAAVLTVLATPALGQGALPDPTRTPGALNPEVTQATIRSTICVRGWTRTIRPPQAYTSALKRQQIRELGYPDQRMSAYAEDHLVPLSLGGAPYGGHHTICTKLHAKPPGP